MRHLTSHKVNGCNEALVVKALDGPGPGGASHRYVLYVPYDAFNEELNASLACYLNFQNGAVKEVGTNGITHEALLAVLIDRLEGFQSGKFKNDFNAEALSHLKAAQDTLLARTRERLARGVEGTLTV